MNKKSEREVPKIQIMIAVDAQVKYRNVSAAIRPDSVIGRKKPNRLAVKVDAR